MLAECLAWRSFKLHEDLGRGNRQFLAGPNVDRHAGPPPVVDRQLDRDEGLNGGVRTHTRDAAIADVLPSHHVLRIERPNSLKQKRALIADRFVVVATGWIHG